MALIDLPKTGPDSWQGMRVVMQCMAIMSLTAAGSRSSGVIYIGIMEEFKVQREQASWPISTMGCMLSLTGLIAGPLAQRFSLRPVILGGALLVPTGLILSFFAPSIAWLTFTYGVVYGAGIGSIHTLNVIFLQQYFVKKRGLALGMNYAGSTLAGFIFPLLLTFLIEEYGFKGAILIFGGILIHIFALCLMHHEAPWIKGQRRKVKDDEAPKAVSENAPKDQPTEMTLTKVKEADPKPAAAGRVTFRQSLSVFRERQLYIVVVSFTAFMYAYDAYFTTIVDYIVDQDIPLLQATSVVPLYSFTDMIARLTIPQLGDRGYIDTRLLSALAYSLQTLCFVLLPFVARSGAFASIAVLCMVHNAAIGTSIVMYGVLMAEAIEPARLPMAYAVSGLFAGSLYFTKPFLVGYFRDTVGDYSWMFVFCGGLTCFSALIWYGSWLQRRLRSRQAAGGPGNGVDGSKELPGPHQPSANDPASARNEEDSGPRSRSSTVMYL